MNVNIAPTWKEQIYDEFDKDYFKNLISFVNSEYKKYDCYPQKEQIFAAFSATTFSDVKVVILGQDPYHGAMQANGLSFSVNDGVSHPPSLQNIFKELHTDTGVPIPESGNLKYWASQGVLLLNATLTVRANEAGSHQRKGWEQFTDAVIQKISDNREGVIFLLWGGYAKKKGSRIDTKKHYVFTSGHPSPLSANRGYWFGNKHFSKTNTLLNKLGKETIKW